MGVRGVKNSGELVWPTRWEGLTHEERRDDLLRTMLATPPRHLRSYIGISVKLPKVSKLLKKKLRDAGAPRGFRIPTDSLLYVIDQAVPRGMSPQVRDEAIQDIAVAILTGEVDKDDLASSVQSFVRKVLRMYPSKYGPVSLDATMPGTEGMTLLDTLGGD